MGKGNELSNQIDLSLYKKPLVLKRTWMIILCFGSAFLMCLLRYNLSVAIVAIVEEPLITLNDDGTEIIEQKYKFGPIMTGHILASYFYGYTIFQFPAGRLSELFGGKLLLGLSTFFSGLLSFLLPFALDYGGPIALIIDRFLIGVMHCSVLSCSYTFFSEWLPKEKKSFGITMINVGFDLGGVTSFYLTGIITKEIGWRYSFYIFSIFAFIWCIPFYFLVTSRPDDDKKMSEYERKLIERERMIELAQDFSNKNLIKIPPKFKWKIVLTSKPVICSCIAKAAVALGYYIVTTKMPSYLNDVFGVENYGLLTSIACIGILSSKILCLKLSTYLIQLNLMSLTNLRKTFQSITLLIPATTLFIITIIKDSNLIAVIILIFITMFGKGFICLGDAAISAEFAKDLSGSIFGFTNTFACASGILAPVLSGYFLDKYSDEKVFAWNLTFYVTIIFYLIALIFFLMWATAESQSWAESTYIIKDDKFSQLQIHDHLQDHHNPSIISSQTTDTFA